MQLLLLLLLQCAFITFTSGVYTDSNGWTRATMFVQPNGQPMSALPKTDYEAIFKADPNWIKGAGVAGEPTDADPPLNAFLVQSVDWSKLLVSGKKYKLRQNFYRHKNKKSAYDVAYTFTYGGYVTQNDAIVAQASVAQAFMLSDKEVCQDTTGITWATGASQMRFWLPIVDGADALIKAGASVYTGCGGFSYDNDGCGLNIDTARRYGNAGIIPDAKGNNSDMSASWAPLLDTASKNGGAHDLLLVRNGKRANDVQGSVYGNLGGAGGVVLQYWICDMSVGDCKCPAYGGGIGGVIFLAIVFSTGSIYCIAGVMLNRRKDPGMSIKESIPHPQFWGSVPGLAKEGCGFFFWCFRRRAGMAVAAQYSPYEAL